MQTTKEKQRGFDIKTCRGGICGYFVCLCDYKVQKSKRDSNQTTIKKRSMHDDCI